MPSYKSIVQQAGSDLAQQKETFFEGTFTQEALINSSIETVRNFDDDISRLKKDAHILFKSPDAQKNAGNDLAQLFDKWRDNPPSTTALICFAAEHFDIPADDKNLKAAIMAGIAAEVDNNNPYHSNHHFREVTATMARLCNTNNELAAGGQAGGILLDTGNIAKCLLAAAGHDLMHDGKTNSLQGPESHEQYRLENKAIEAIEPFMKLTGMSSRDQEDVRVMIRITDISAKPGQPSPHKHLKEITALSAQTFVTPPELLSGPVAETRISMPPDVAAGKIQSSFISLPPDAGKSPVETTITLPGELADLARNKQLLVMSTLMSDADLGPSTATNFEYSRKMTTLLSHENPALADSNKTLDGFLTFVVGGKLTSDAGQKASGNTLATIMQEAKKPDNGGPNPAGPKAQSGKPQPQ